jgi:hypothetical protein
MSRANEDDISLLLEQWYETKESISELEVKMEKYKKLAGRIMCKKDTNTISSDRYVLKKRDLSRETISKKDLPLDIWKNYCNKIDYSAFYISKK